MSIRLPYVNGQMGNSAAASVRLQAPTADCAKPANQACVRGMFIRGPSAPFPNTQVRIFAGQQNAGTSGNDGYLRFGEQGMTTIEARVAHTGVTRFQTSVSLGGSAYDKALLVMIVVDNGYSYLVVCEPGGTPIIGTHAGSDLYSRAMTGTTYLMEQIGAAKSYPYYGAVEEAFYLFGSFPGATSGALDTNLIQAIADGTQSLDTLDTMLTGGSRRWRYRMRDETDLADAWGLAGALTPQNINAPTGYRLRTAGTIRPVALRPALCHDTVSQVSFATPGDPLTATATVRTEGGTYVGITPAVIQARLVKDDGSTLVNWTTVDAAPSGGSWAAGAIPNVLLTAGFLRLDFRAVDGGGAQIGDTVSSHGQRGAGFCLLTEGQSQLMFMWGTSALALPDGIQLSAVQQGGTTDGFGATLAEIIASGDPTGKIATWGIRQAAIEINTIYPGVPIQMMTVGQVGENIDQWTPGGLYVNRWGYLATHLGVVPPYNLAMFGHSALGNPYEGELDQAITAAETALGAPELILVCPTARYSMSGTGGSWVAVQSARDGARAWLAAHSNRGWWAGSWSVVATSEAASPDPHPSATAAGQGRSGALLGWAALMGARAAEDEPVGLVSAKAAGTAVTLKFGPIN